MTDTQAPERIWAKAQEWPMGTGRIEVYAAAINDPDDPGNEYIRLDLHTAALTQSRAETAAAYERAAVMVQLTAYTSNGDLRSLEPVSTGLVGMDMHHATIATAIRALATPEQSVALAAVVAAAEDRGREAGMREAAGMVWMVSDKTKCKFGSLVSLAVLETHTTILAAITHKGE